MILTNLFVNLFINFCIFSFFVSLSLVIRVFTKLKPLKIGYVVDGCCASIVTVILMYFSVQYNGFFYDLRFVPLILAFIYSGYRAGWMTFICMSIASIYITDPTLTSIIILGGTILPFTLLKTYMEKHSFIKQSFLYLAVHFVVYSLTFEFASNASAVINFHVGYFLFVFIGMLLGILLIESHKKFYLLTQSLSDLNKTLVKSKQELKDTVREQQGAIFKFKKENDCFIHTLCDGQFYYKHGVHPNQVIGKDLQTIDSSVIPSHLIPKLLDYYKQAWEGHKLSFELPWPDDNSLIFLSLSPIKREGKVIEVVGSAIDITERKKIEEELKTTKERLESFIKHNMDAITMCDVEGNVLKVNQAYEKIFGWSTQEIVGQKLPFVPDLLMDQALKNIQKVISGESITRLETVRQRKDGSLIDICLTLSPIQDSKGKVIAISAISRDISERKQAERELCELHQQLKESEMKYRALFEHAADSIYLIELNQDRFPTRFLEVNPVACERLEYSREEILSRSPFNINSQVSEVMSRITKEIREGKRSFTLQNEYVFKRGEKMHVEISIRAFNLNKKEVVLTICRDITERIKTEELLRKSEKLAVVGQLATAIAHEIRNPLTSIKGFIQLLPSTLNSENMWYVDILSSEVDLIENITNEFMTVAKPQAVKIQPNDLYMIVKQVITLLQPQAIMHNVQIRTRFEADIPLIGCERNQLKQVFINILKNSIEAMPSGGEILIQIDQSDHQVIIRIIDQGCGIPKERIPYLGEPFYSIKEQGIGLGLMVCYKIIEAHQGKIVIESEVGKGTIVEVILPIDAFQTQIIDSGTKDKQQLITNPNLDQLK
ncbi:PAS domain S-box protein [Bacillus megaterium]|nr:PAS domain S-box protein [Priestia megaterium]